MNRVVVATALVLLAAGVALAQQPTKYRAVIEVAGPQEQWAGALTNVENLQNALGKDKVDLMVIAHGRGLGLLLKTDSPLAERIKGLSNTGVVFAACQNSMKRMNVTKEDLLPSVVTVDSAVAEIVRRQHDGWAYLKVGS